MASCTDFCRESLVLWSTGSTDWISMLVMYRLFCLNTKLSRTFSFSLRPNTEARITRAEFLWKSSNGTWATAPLTREAMALQASPTKSGTLKSLAASFASSLSIISKCLEKICNQNERTNCQTITRRHCYTTFDLNKCYYFTADQANIVNTAFKTIRTKHLKNIVMLDLMFLTV